MTATDDHLWIQVDPPIDGIVRVDKQTGEATPMVPGGRGVEAGPEGLWVSCCDWLARIDPVSGEELLRIPVGGRLALADGAAWVYTEDGRFLEVDAVSGSVREAAAIEPSTCRETKDLLVAFDAAWLACREGVVVRVDLTDKTSEVIPTAQGAHTFAATDDSVWVTNNSSGTVTRIEPATGETTDIASVGGTGITVGGGYVWAATATGIAKIDPATSEIVDRIELGTSRYYDLVWDDGVIWASTAKTKPLRVDLPTP